MPDDGTLAPEETPGVETEDTDQGTPSPPATETPENWEQRFKDTQAQYTQSQQELSEYRDYMEKLQFDPDEQKKLLMELADRHNYVLPDEEEPEYQDPGELALQKLEAFETQRAQEQEEQEKDAYWQEQGEGFFEELSKFQEAEGIELSDKAVDFLGAKVLLGGADAQETFKAWLEEQQAGYERIVNSKKNASRATSGSAGSPKFDPNNPEEVEAARIQAAQEAIDSAE